MRVALKFLSFILITVPSYGNESVTYKVNSYLRDGNVEEASELLSKVDMKNKEVFYFLKGRVLLRMNKAEESVKFFKKSISFKFNEKAALILSQLLIKKNTNDEALGLLERIKSKSIQKDLLLAQALWQKDEFKQAVDYLDNSKKNKYASYDLIERQKYFYLFKMGYVKRVFDQSAIYLKDAKNSSEVALQVVSLLKAKDSFLAEMYFDKVLLLRPKDPVLLRERGVFELEKKRPFLAASYFSKAAHIDKKYSFDAAATYLSLGNHSQALFFNQRVEDNSKRLVQLFTIHIDAENYEQALSLKYELEKNKLHDNGKISYALTYAAFKVKDYKSFKDCFSKVTSQRYVTKAIKLKELMDSCKNEMRTECAFS